MTRPTRDGPAPKGKTVLARPDPSGGVTDADMIRAITLGSPDVAGMSGATRTYLPGRTVQGVRVDATTVHVHVVARYGTPLPELTARLDVLLRPVVAGRSFNLHVEDIELPGEELPGEELPGEPAVAGR